MISCEFDYCIYNQKNECQLKDIHISPLGVCEYCLIPEIDYETLEKYKKETLERSSRRKL